MEELIRISTLNDFLFCPASINYHNLMDKLDRVEYQSEFQLKGAAAHRCIDSGSYTTSKGVLLGTEVSRRQPENISVSLTAMTGMIIPILQA